MFADDLAQVTNKYEEVQAMLNIAVDYFKKAPGLTFGPNKCEVLAENFYSEMVNINLNGIYLETVSKQRPYKYFGVWWAPDDHHLKYMQRVLKRKQEQNSMQSMG